MHYITYKGILTTEEVYSNWTNLMKYKVIELFNGTKLSVYNDLEKELIFKVRGKDIRFNKLVVGDIIDMDFNVVKNMHLYSILKSAFNDKHYELNDDISRLFGYMFINMDKYLLSFKSKKLYYKTMDTLEDYFSCYNSKLNNVDNKTEFNIGIDCKLVKEFLTQNYLTSSEVPLCIRKGSWKNIISYISGVLDALSDGTNFYVDEQNEERFRNIMQFSHYVGLIFNIRDGKVYISDDSNNNSLNYLKDMLVFHSISNCNILTLEDDYNRIINITE